MPLHTRVRLVRREILSEDFIRLRLENPFGSPPPKPGQFVMLGASEGTDPFLRRPFSIHRMSPDGRFFDLLVKVVGRGTKRLAEIPEGTPLPATGPLGRPFSLDTDADLALLVGGGVGLAPFPFLAEELKKRGVPMLALFGGRTPRDLVGREDLDALGVEVRVATEDGREGLHGRVTDLLTAWLPERPARVILYACGPDGMLKAVGRFGAEQGIGCELSLEAMMGCGFGVCLGCVVHDAEGRYVRVCTEGPVIDARRLRDYGFGPGKKGGEG